MNMHHLSILAGVMSTSIFTLSHIPMLVRAYRTRDLRSYSPANLVLSNIGNAFHWLYIINLPLGPIWFLHSFYTLVAGLMLFWYLRYGHTTGVQSPREPGRNTLAVGRLRNLDERQSSSPGRDS
jgi:uncharacterized protein with PQ loop repeat